MPRRQIVGGQRVNGAKRELARDMRKNPTTAEDWLWEQVRGKHFGVRFRRQQTIFGLIVDFYAHQPGLVVEVDGPVHDSRVEVDEQRDAILRGCGLTVLHVTNDEIRDRPASVLARIGAACRTAPKT